MGKYQVHLLLPPFIPSALGERYRAEHITTYPLHFLFYLDFILPIQTFHFLTDWGTLFNSFIHLCLQAGTNVTVNKNGRALQAPLSPPYPFVCKVAAVNLIEGECCDYLMVSQAAVDWRIKFRICFPRR